MDARKKKENGGYSLIEVMVAMAISLIVLAGVYKAITDETIMVARDEAVLDMQNNARAAIARIAGDLRRTVFFGCGGKASRTPAGFPTDFPLTVPTVLPLTGPPIAFSDDDATGGNNIDDGTDSITLRFLGGDVPLDPTDPSTILDDSTKAFELARRAFTQNELLLITDCEEFAVFTKTNGNDTFSLVHGVDLVRAYGTPRPARVYSFESSTYRIDGANLRLNGQVIAANIEDLQFEFVEDTNHDDVLDEAWSETFTNAEDVRAVRVWVLAMSDTAYTYTDNNTYDYPNSPYYSGTTPFSTNNGAGGSPASLAGLAKDRKHRYRYLASAIIYLRNAGI
jgi:type IV pilus assembly protein PilW